MIFCCSFSHKSQLAFDLSPTDFSRVSRRVYTPFVIPAPNKSQGLPHNVVSYPANVRARRLHLLFQKLHHLRVLQLHPLTFLSLRDAGERINNNLFNHKKILTNENDTKQLLSVYEVVEIIFPENLNKKVA